MRLRAALRLAAHGRPIRIRARISSFQQNSVFACDRQGHDVLSCHKRRPLKTPLGAASRASRFTHGLLTCAVLIVNLNLSQSAKGQQSTNSAATKSAASQKPSTPPSQAPPSTPASNSQPTTPSPTPTPTTGSSLAQKIAADAKDIFGDIGDYVPCEFSRLALLSLRPAPQVITLTARDEDEFRSRVIAQALDTSNAGAFPQGQLQRDFFVESIAQTSFQGRTPSDAMGKVTELLWSATQTNPEATRLKYAAEGTNATFADYIQESYGSYGIDRDKLLKVLGQQEQTPQSKLDAVSEVAAQEVSTTEAASTGGKELLAAASKSNPEFANYLQNYAINSTTAMKELGSEDQSPQAKLAVASKLAQAELTANPTANDLLSAASGKNQDFAQYLNKQFNLDVSSKLGPTELAPDSKLEIAHQAATASKDSAAQTAANKAIGAASLSQTVLAAQKMLAVSNLTEAASQAQATTTGKPAQNQIALAAQQATAALTRPIDVGCSMTILSYETTRYAFGDRVADEFIPVQIVVRNLNPNQEFLVHDAQVAVDEDINGRLGRYFSGTDKLTTRTFMISSRDFSARNLTVHIAQGVGTILSSASLVYGVAVKDAANVYSAGFLNALLGVLPDHSTDQLNLLNDEGFSSYRTERTVVPKSGTAEFVIFIRSDQFHEAWWVQDCAESIIIKSPQNVQQNNPKASAHCLGQLNLPKPDPKCLANSSSNIGIDLDDARRVCAHVYNPKAQGPKSGCTADSDARSGACKAPQLIDVGTADDITGDLAYFKPKKVHYESWSPRAQAIFRELALAVVAGTHIQEQAATKSALTKVDCPVDAAGDVDFDKAENGNLTCPLTGTNLDQVQALKLKNSENRTDTNTASGTVSTKTSGTSKTTQAVFTLASLGALPAKLYKVYTENTDGTEGGGDLPLNFSGDPYLPASGKPSPAEINLADVQSSKDGVPVTLSGYHLDQVQSVQFAGPANGNTPGPAMTIPLASGSTATTAKVAITAADLKKANITGQMALSITLVLKAAPAAAAKTNKQTLSLTGKPSAAPAPPPPATAKITFAPPSGKAGKPVKITGTGLKNTTSVKFGGVAATSMNVDSDTQVTATVPAGAKTGKIVLTINGSPVTSTKNFTVQ